ncbi:leucine-rich repeat and calponin homology domain-containing protein 2 isoform X2 [Takifugu flavidus]|uniref:leucine-rich repeat and calponin homology domain-containing protein 2 isoform X2 n=1 Tax=Takifugu flavidus TaxID=433684 RepID=UPI0025445A2A|nr:leucine-rich repeat and calponin homology domain-containing protein 2 isoform X2 [Takifugu flavidus]
MSSLGPESSRPILCLLCSPRSIPTHVSSSNLPPNRGLERALEEASSSGVLNLSSRKLKEFPQTAANHDLSDTVEADLSKNRLADFAADICHFVALETLNLYHNCIKTIPDSIISLQSLTSLNISRNQICSLPPCLCSLPLRVLNASNNRLDSLPETIGQLSNLMELDVSCNDISALPRQIGRLRALRELNVRRNTLCVLPEDLAELPLVTLDFSCNKVSTIPACYRKMKHLQSLQLDNNPLQIPPAQICIKGKVHIFKYLTMEACRSEKLPVPLYLPVMKCLSQPTTGSVDKQRKQDSDSGVSSDNGDKRLSATEPSDEDSPSMPRTHATEEDGIRKADMNPVPLIEEDPTEALRDQGPKSLHSGFVSYIKGRAAGLDEPLRIEEELQWPAQQVVSVKVDNVRESNHNQDSDARVATSKQLDSSPGSGPQSRCSPVFGLKQRSVFLGSHRSVESADPQFTMRRKMEQLREELALMEQLRHSIESRLKLILPEDLGPFLMDGVVLCHLANHLHPCSVAGIHVPSPAAPKLGMAKCRRNVENFLEACRKQGVPEANQQKCLSTVVPTLSGLAFCCDVLLTMAFTSAASFPHQSLLTVFPLFTLRHHPVSPTAGLHHSSGTRFLGNDPAGQETERGF